MFQFPRKYKFLPRNNNCCNDKPKKLQIFEKQRKEKIVQGEDGCSSLTIHLVIYYKVTENSFKGIAPIVLKPNINHSSPGRAPWSTTVTRACDGPCGHIMNRELGTADEGYIILASLANGNHDDTVLINAASALAPNYVAVPNTRDIFEGILT